MANHKSALKRARQDEVRRLRNKSIKTRVKNIIKDIRETANKNESKEVFLKSLDAAKSIIDKSAKKGVIHKRTAARKISRLSKLIPS
ncbi:30S ribosomal protein S20 [Desulfobacterium sp. N47]|uniref:30S ribosomal protein S20 n=1 Tax=Desulfobacterium sp. N47 TaxID=3115210 RepID=UPI003F4A3B47